MASSQSVICQWPVDHMSVACQLSVGGLSVTCRWLVGYKSVACQLYVGGLSVTCRGLLVICRPTLGPMVSGWELFFTMLMLFL